MNADPELCYLTAVQARDRFVERSLSPVELVTSLVARIEDVEPKVNAFTHTFFDRALDEARAAEKRYAGRGARPRPLEGIPIVIKDSRSCTSRQAHVGNRLATPEFIEHDLRPVAPWRWQTGSRLTVRRAATQRASTRSSRSR